MIKNIYRLFTIPLATLSVTVAMSGTGSEDANTVDHSTLTVASEPRFTGFSNDAVSADAGLAGMHEACSAAYGVGARMCLDIEVFKTPELKTDPSVARGWLQPTSNLSGDNPGSLSCNGWSVNSGSAATWLTGRMQITYGSKHYQVKHYDNRNDVNSHCEQQLPVACCK
jgi:hypothetical protein